MHKKITVYGATGMIGQPVTRELIKAGFEVTALVREVARARAIFPEGVTLVQGDLDDKASIAEAMKTADGIYVNISTRPDDKEHAFNPERQGLDNILDAAKALNIKQVAYLSSFLARNYRGDWWVMRAKQSSIERVKKSGLPYTIFYPSNFMENFAGGMVRNGKITIPKISEANKAWWIAGSDFGKQVARAFQIDSALNREFPVQGPEGMTMPEAAQAFADHYTGAKLAVGTMPFGLMKILGWVVPQMKFLSKLMGVMLHNKETFESQATWDTLGAPELTIRTFAQQARLNL